MIVETASIRRPFCVSAAKCDKIIAHFCKHGSDLCFAALANLTMPELPDVIVYVESLKTRFLGKAIQKIHLRSPFLVRSFEIDLYEAEGKSVCGFRRLGKRIIWELEDELFLVFHLMIAGRYHLRKPNSKPTGKKDLAAFCFDDATVMLTEASTKKRASLHVVRGEDMLMSHNPNGLEVLECRPEEFATRIRSRNHTLKRALTSPSLFSGIGNAYSDEILHGARLSPLKHTQKLTDDEVQRLFEATRETLSEWLNRHRDRAKQSFPEKVTAFHKEMAVHGKYGQACPTCGSIVQRIVYSENETNYCPGCQTEGRILADRSLSRLLKDDWPRTVEEWNEVNS